MASNDGGVGISLNRGATWNRVQFPNAQIYHVTTDNQIPYLVYGNRQDGPSFRGPSNSLIFGYGQFVPDITRDQWITVGGGESGWTISDPTDPAIVWSSGTGAGSIGGSIDRYDERTREYRPVEVWPDNTEGWAAGDLKYRFNWTFPVAMSPHDHRRIYTGSQYVHMTSDGGQSWKLISPDLTLNDTTRLGPSGGLTGDNIGPEYGGTLMSIAESPKQAGVIWTGSNDGQVQVTRDAGKTWTNVSAAIPGLPAWGTIYTVEPSRYQAGTAYITVDLHQENNRDPFVYKTTNFGKTWTSLASTLPKSMLSYAHCIKEDPVRPGMLYLGTEGGLYVSFDDGDNWQSLQNNLPHVPVYGITVQEHFNDLVLATYGRGFWILDDITSLRNMQPNVTSSDAYLFPPRPAYRWRGRTPTLAQSYDPTAGQNPAYGANIDYFLKAAPAEDVRISILDARGQTVRTMRGTRTAGVNRVYWDFRYPPSSDIRLRTSPIYASWMKPPEDGRPAGGRLALLAPPGIYTVKLVAGGKEFTQPLKVLRDPHAGGTDADIQAQFALMQSIRDNVQAVGQMVNRLETMRKQLLDLQTSQPAVREQAGALEQTLRNFEENFVQLKVSGGQDGMRWPAKLTAKLQHLATQVQETDYAPTAQQIAVNQQFTAQIKTLRTRLDELTSKEIAQFNQFLKGRSMPALTASGQE